MSSPIKKMLSSRSISSRSASRSAARNRVSGIAVHLPFAGVQVAVELVDSRVRALVGEADDLFDFAFDLLLDPFDLGRRGDAGLLQLVLEEKYRVAMPPLRLLLFSAVLVRVDDRVTSEPIVHCLDEPRL